MTYLNNFNHQIFGKRGEKRLVFLHGLMGSLANWRKITSHFTEEYEIFIYDQRGHGRSFQPQEGYSPEDYSRDLKILLDELGWDKVHLIGHSMGGRNALNFTFNHPEYVERLVIEDISPGSNKDNPRDTIKLLELVPTPFANREDAREFFVNVYPNLIKFHPQPEILSQYFYANIVEDKLTGKADWRFYKPGILASVEAGHAKDRWNELESLRVPSLIVRGQKSNELDSKGYERMLNSNPLVSGVEIEGAGHWVHNDKPTEFVAILKNFLKA